MSESVSVERAILVHRPLGDEHPYAAGPAERTPRYPLAGEKVTLGIQVTDVDQTAANFVSAVREAKGVVAVGPQIGYKPNGEAAGRIVFAVPLCSPIQL